MSSSQTPSAPTTVQEIWSLLNLVLGIAITVDPAVGVPIKIAEDLFLVAQQALALHAQIANVPMTDVISRLHPVVPPVVS